MGIPDEAIAGADYEPGVLTGGTLTIDFQHGGSYEYEGVPPEIYQGLLVGGGHFFNAAIRDAYPGHRVSGSVAGRALKKIAADAIIAALTE